jgi:uncharacterized protein
MKSVGIVLVLVVAGATGMLLGGIAAPALHRANAATATAEVTAQPAATGPAAVVVPPAAAGAVNYRTVGWDALVPKDWDPLKKYRGMNFDAMSDSDPRAIEMLRRMRESWDNAPVNNAMDDQQVRIAGYLVPLDETKAGLTRFLLVPYFGACIHTPPPPSNQIIDVTPTSPARFKMMAPVWVSGTLRTLHSDTVLGSTSYRMQAKEVEWYTPGLDHGLGGPPGR